MTLPFDGPEKHHILCPYCQRTRRATEEGCARWNDSDEEPSLVMLVKCDTCQKPILFSQDLTDDSGELYLAWPRENRYLSTAVPRPLRNEHAQARKCFYAKAFTAAAVMVGRTLEGVCAENGFEERNLIASLKKMKDAGKIDERLYDWANELRVLRNEGAHYTGSQVSRQDAEDALALSEAMLEYMYVLTARFDEFKQRRAARANDSAQQGTDTTGGTDGELRD